MTILRAFVKRIILFGRAPDKPCTVVEWKLAARTPLTHGILWHKRSQDVARLMDSDMGVSENGVLYLQIPMGKMMMLQWI